eukprot:4272730-Amphidinium_carterae.1
MKNSEQFTFQIAGEWGFETALTGVQVGCSLHNIATWTRQTLLHLTRGHVGHGSFRIAIGHFGGALSV